VRRTALVVLVVAAFASSCGGGGGGGGSSTIQVDGSSTVGPFTTAAAERFQKDQPDVNVTVGVSGTGGGFERFCRGETDISDASRPIEADEKATCQKNGIDYVEFQMANDAISVVVNPDNEWADCLTLSQVKKIWEPGSKVSNWNQVDPQFPDEKLTLYGPGTDSGTFDYFTEQILGEEGTSRSDYTASENDNVLVRGVEAEKGALGYFGFSYYEENQHKLTALAIDGGDGCVEPTVETAQDGTYKPLSRPLFIYVKRSSLDREAVSDFVEATLQEAIEIAEASDFVPLTRQQQRQQVQKFADVAGGP
jgi:phosphate transport system substrate-binding protein